MAQFLRNSSRLQAWHEVASSGCVGVYGNFREPQSQFKTPKIKFSTQRVFICPRGTKGKELETKQEI